MRGESLGCEPPSDFMKSEVSERWLPLVGGAGTAFRSVASNRTLTTDVRPEARVFYFFSTSC